MEDIRLSWLENNLTEPSQKARRNLLLSSSISILLIEGQLVPTKISALGISIDEIQKETILKALICLTIYYFVKFYIYSFIDGEKLSYKNKKAVLGSELPENYADVEKEYQKKSRGMYEKIGGRILVWSLLKLGVDFTFPLILSVYAMYILINAF